MTIEKQAEEYANKNGMPQIKQKCIYEAITKAYIKGYQDANQWISVSEQMPIEIIGFYNCLVIRNDKQIRQARFNALMQRFQNMNFEDIHDSVTHWMPLPSTESINLK